jgi:uncharacterized protein YlxW (UPF0749 family)
MRQLYTAAVVPTTDYATPVWYAPSRISVKRHVDALERLQRLAARLIFVSMSVEKNRLYHDKNKLAARNPRLRQRREARTVQETVRLEEENTELNAQLCGLQGEIDELRAFAPDHQ